MKYSFLLGRILFAAIFVLAAPHHLREHTIKLAEQHGVFAAEDFVPLFGLIGLAGGLSVLLGYHAKAGAWLLVVFLVPVTLAMHNFWDVADPNAAEMQQMMFMKNLAMIGGALFIAYFGSGPFSLDDYLKLYVSSAHPIEKTAVPVPAGAAQTQVPVPQLPGGRQFIAFAAFLKSVMNRAISTSRVSSSGARKIDEG